MFICRLNYALCALIAATTFGFVNPTVAQNAPKISGDLTRILADERAVLRKVQQNDVIIMTRVDALKPRKKPAKLPKIKPSAQIASNSGVDTKGVPSKSRLNAMPRANGNSEWACLTEALYFEARGESIAGMFAVAEVIINRKASRKFPNSICGVISQGAHRRNACQFSYKCDGMAEAYHEPRAYALVGKIAQISLERQQRPLTKGATFYHATSVNPKWSRVFARTARIGKHYFYRPS